jgi:uncharacterized metal-binding protein
MDKMDNSKDSCMCSSSDKIVLACSGASDIGHITDLVARKLGKNKIRKMNCLAVIGADIEKSIESFKGKNILVIDGCPIDCGKRIMDKNGFANYHYMRVTDIGYKKGETHVTEEVINSVYEIAKTYV